MGSPDGVDLERLARWMDGRGLGRGPLEAVTPLTGGTQNILIRFRRDGREYVLRRPPPHLRANSNETMRREARVLAALAGSDVPHPALIAACPEEDVLGAAFYLMEPVEGFNATVGLPPLHAGDPSIRRRMGFALVDGALSLSRVDPFAAGLGDLSKLDGYLERQVPRWRSQLESYAALPGWPGPAEIPGVDDTARWLEAHRPSNFKPGLIHGDYYFANVMYRHDGPELAAIVDWELTALGDPLLDLGWILAMWPEAPEAGGVEARPPVTPWSGFPTSDELVARYAAHSGRDMDAVPWFAVLACYKLGIILEGTHARACAGKAPKETGDRLHGMTLRLFERARRWIGGTPPNTRRGRP